MLMEHMVVLMSGNVQSGFTSAVLVSARQGGLRLPAVLPARRQLSSTYHATAATAIMVLHLHAACTLPALCQHKFASNREPRASYKFYSDQSKLIQADEAVLACRAGSCSLAFGRSCCAGSAPQICC